MVQAIQTVSGDQLSVVSSQLLADKKLLSVKRATAYLVGRLRIRTPAGACEFLKISTFGENGRAAYDERVEIAATVCGIYRELFPREYLASQAPPFSAQREQEFYRLVERRLFPLRLEECDTDDPEFFLPGIPVTGTQQHDWINGCCPFDALQTVFKIVLVLAGMKPGKWRSLGLKKAPALPLGPVGWTFFVCMCAVEESPLSALPFVFHLVSYKTQNPWLDVPPGAGVFLEWNEHNVAKLTLALIQAREINRRVLALNKWLVEKPGERIGRAVELWNLAAEMEASE